MARVRTARIPADPHTLAALILSFQIWTMAAAQSAWAGEADAAEFAIPAQSLADALERFMAMTRATVTVDSAVVSSRRSAAVAGAMTPEAALHTLLEGTGLDARAIGPDAYALVPRAAEAQPRHAAYAGAIQNAVTTALCGAPETSPTHYRTVLRLWLTPSGTVSRAELGTSTGRPGLDARIVDALRQVNVGAPVPAGLPQPVKLAVLPRASSVCAPDQAQRP